MKQPRGRFPPVSSPTVATRYLQLSYGKLNIVSFVKMTRSVSNELMKKLDALAEDYDGCVDVVSVIKNHWLERVYLSMSSLDLAYTRVLQDSDRAQLWSSNNVTESGTVLLFSREMEPLCEYSLSKDFKTNVTALMAAVKNRVDSMLQLPESSTTLDNVDSNAAQQRT